MERGDGRSLVSSQRKKDLLSLIRSLFILFLSSLHPLGSHPASQDLLALCSWVNHRRPLPQFAWPVKGSSNNAELTKLLTILIQNVWCSSNEGRQRPRSVGSLEQEAPH